MISNLIFAGMIFVNFLVIIIQLIKNLLLQKSFLYKKLQNHWQDSIMNDKTYTDLRLVWLSVRINLLAWKYITTRFSKSIMRKIYIFSRACKVYTTVNQLTSHSYQNYTWQKSTTYLALADSLWSVVKLIRPIENRFVNAKPRLLDGV